MTARTYSPESRRPKRLRTILRIPYEMLAPAKTASCVAGVELKSHATVRVGGRNGIELQSILLRHCSDSVTNVPKVSASGDERKEEYDCFARRELEHGMSASSSPLSSLHHIGIIMSPVGRFLQSSDCQLGFTFPDGVRFGDLRPVIDLRQPRLPH
jgi:hypothetical protein